MAATSMAAAIAASLPAATSAPAPAAPTFEAIPASMAKVIDAEAEIPIETIQLDGMVVSKIIKHAGDSRNATGLLLGLDLDGVLEISNSFPLPHASAEEDDKGNKALSRYQNTMLTALKDVQSDDNIVGFYLATPFNAFFTSNLLEMQSAHQARLRQGGIVVVHDTTQAQRGNASFRAFRLTWAFQDAHRRGDFGSSSLAAHRLTFSTILEEVPLKVRTNALLSAFVSVLGKPTGSRPAAVPPSFSALDLGAASLSRTLERTLEALDASRAEENNAAYHARQIGRAKAQAEAALQKRRDENVVRTAQGLQPLPEDDVLRAYKIPPEPSRLDGLLLLGQVDAHARALEDAASLGLAKMYAARGTADV